MIRIDLQDGWKLAPLSGSIPAGLPERIPASVPGCVHTDLLAAGLIPDPFLDANEAQLQWIGRSEFAYDTQFTVPNDGPALGGDLERIDLVCEGLDTFAGLELNGTAFGSTRNQHRSYRFALRELLRTGQNDLRITFSSALDEAERAELRLGHRPNMGNAHPYNAIRKMAANFGWDWGPTLITAGIWRPIYLHGWSTARLTSVVPLATVAHGDGIVSITITTERASDRPLTIRARLRGHGSETRISAQSTQTQSTQTSATLELRIANPKLWWPRGYGDQPLYDLLVELVDGDTVLDSFERSIGFRTVEVRAEPDEFGTGFTFYINGQRILIKGANWIPDDCFPSRVTPDDYAASVRDATEAGFNLLRVWGGGIFESDELYALCDREGVMVWQDFLFACAAYSEAPELWDEVEAEVRENVARLAPHPSLVYYNGGNENVEGYYNWGWKEQLAPGQGWGNGYFERLLPAVLTEVDPTRPYAPSSPFSPHDPTQPQDPDHGTVHSWEVWNRQDYSAYRNGIPRFVAEFGFQGPPNFSTLKRSIHDDPLTSDSVGMIAHQKAEGGNSKLQRGYAPHLPEPTSFDDWHFTTQLNQARAITFGVEHFRSHFPRTTGTIVWQLNDCWPVTSWAAVDGDRRRKPLWYALRALNAARLLTFQPRDGDLALIASNDSGQPWREQVAVRRIGLDGIERASQFVELDVPPRSNATTLLDAGVALTSDATHEVLTADSDHTRRAYWYFVEDLHLALEPPAMASRVQRTATGYAIELTADSYLKDIVVNPDRLDADATVDTMLLTLLPGETTVISVTTAQDLDEHALVTHPVLQSVNHLLENSRR